MQVGEVGRVHASRGGEGSGGGLAVHFVCEWWCVVEVWFDANGSCLKDLERA